MRSIHGTMMVLAVTLAACGKKPDAAQAPPADSGRMMGGSQTTLQGMQMIPMMGAHLDSLGTIAPAQMAAVMPAHLDLASRVMDAMGADMRGMNMQPDAAWMALNDSLRQDLAGLPSLSGGALQARMQAHIARMRRMMTMHQGMMHM